MAIESTPAAAPASAAASTATPTTATTSTPSTSAPATSAPATTTTSESPAAGPLTPEETTSAMVAAAEKAGYGSKPEAEVKAPEPDGTVKEAPKTATETTPAAEKKEDLAPAVDANEDKPNYSLEAEAHVGAKDLAAKIDANPALKAALPAELRNEIMANARLAETGSEYAKIFASPAEAEVVAQTAQEFAGYSEAFTMVGSDPEKGTTALINKLIEGSAFRDENGNLLKDENGKLQTDGTAGAFLDKVFERGFYLNIEKKVDALGDENVRAALDLVMESVGLRPSTADEDQNQDPALTARKAELDAQEARIKAERAASTEAVNKEYATLRDTELAQVYDSEVEALLSSATALSKLERSAVETQIFDAVSAARKANVAFNEKKRLIERERPSPARRAKEVANVKRFLRENLVRIAKPILAEAGVSVGKKAEERAAAQAARAENARSEVQGGSASQPATPVNPTDQAALRSAIAAELKQKLGREPDDSEITVLQMVKAAEKAGYTSRAA